MFARVLVFGGGVKVSKVRNRSHNQPGTVVIIPAYMTGARASTRQRQGHTLAGPSDISPRRIKIFLHGGRGRSKKTMKERHIKMRLIITPLPQGVHGMSAKDADTILVLVNEDDTPDEQRHAFIHECLHVWYEDHDREGVNVQDLERVRNQQTRQEIERQEGNT